MNHPTRLFLLLAALTVLLMSIPFLVPHCGWLALIGWVPLLCLEHIASQTGIRRLWPGLFAIFANALQMSLIFGLFRLSKKHFTGVVPYLFLALAWIAWERWYLTSAQISWPWLVLGNAFARSTGLVQWYEYTGTLGGTLWVWAVNLSVFGMMVSLSNGNWQRWNGKARAAAVIGLVALLAAPVAVSMVLFARYEEPQEKLPVIIAQPNIDPYHKFEALSQDEQNAILEDQFRQALRGRKRHPTLGNYVTVYSGASILGGASVIGDGAVIGSNAFITSSVEPGARVSIQQTTHKGLPSAMA